MDLFRVCQRWLLVMCAVSVVIGALLIVAGDAPFMAAYNDNVVRAFDPNGVLAGAALAQHQWALGVTGAGTIGWALTLAFVIAIPFARREAWAWWCVATSVALWVVVDVALSLYWGVVAEALFATSAGFGFAVPLLLVRRQFVSTVDA